MRLDGGFWGGRQQLNADAIIPQLLDGRTDLVSGLTLKTSLGMGGHNAAVVLAPNA